MLFTNVFPLFITIKFNWYFKLKFTAELFVVNSSKYFSKAE